MSEQPPLDSLTLKDLRKLAGEHQVPNRSTLNKQQLLGALSSTLRDRLGKQSEADVTPDATEIKKKPVNKPSKKPSAKPSSTKTPEEKPASEPEVLTPDSVSHLATSTRNEAQTNDETPSSETSASTAPAATEHDDSQVSESDGTGEEPRKRKRRRRRRRGRGNESHESSGESDEATASPEGQGHEEATADTDHTEKKAVEESAPEEQQQPSNRDNQRKRDNRRDSRDGDRRQKRPPRPRLQGQQRSLPAVLDRLRWFSSGILELCDPDTPSWAQARLGELLAEVGVVPTPCSGQAHPDFHHIEGEEAVEGVAPGEISMVIEPGFALRGDRGDLFALRKAKVKVAPGDNDAPQDDEASETKASKTEVDSAPTNIADSSEPIEGTKQGDEQAATQPEPEDGGGQPEDPKSEVAPPASADERRDQNKRGSRRNKVDPNPAAETVAEADEEAAIEIASEPAPAPKARPGRRHRPADDAPTLPLQQIEAEELAARPKAEAFRELGLNEQILADLHSIGFEQPSPIQAAAIPVVTTGKDLIGQAMTGTGKTAAFSLPVLNRLYSLEGKGPVALVLCPTRELARQVHHEVSRMSGTSGARSALIYGGVGMDDQIEALSRNPHIVIGTPGRLIDHLKRKNLDTSRIQMVVMDEADQMLDIGFLPDITYILKHTPKQRQTLLFSATMPDEIKRLATDYMTDPEHVHTMPESVTVDKVDQKFIAVDQDKKTAVLAHFIETQKPEQMVVFCKTKHQTDRVAKVLKSKDLSAGAIHGDLSQSRREQSLRKFREGKLTCLIATNVAARGLDIPSVSHVVNYDVPETPEEYVHRIGRTGRMGAEGIARTFVTREDGQFLLEIEKHIGLLLDEEVIEGITTSTASKKNKNPAAKSNAPRMLKAISGGIRLGRRRR